MMKPTSICCVALAALLSSTTARADDTGSPHEPSEPAAEAQPAPLPEPPAPLPEPPAPVPPDRGRFSGKRLVVEMLAGAVAGSLVGIGMYKAAGGDGIGAVMAGLGAEIAVTPLVVWGTGRAMGGRGTLGWTYVGGLAAFAGPSMTTEQAVISFAVGMVMMPVTSALLFEVSSHGRSKRFEAVARGVAITPVVDQRGVSGVRAGLSFAF